MIPALSFLRRATRQLHESCYTLLYSVFTGNTGHNEMAPCKYTWRHSSRKARIHTSTFKCFTEMGQAKLVPNCFTACFGQKQYKDCVVLKITSFTCVYLCVFINKYIANAASNYRLSSQQHLPEQNVCFSGAVQHIFQNCAYLLLLVTSSALQNMPVLLAQ